MRRSSLFFATLLLGLVCVQCRAQVSGALPIDTALRQPTFEIYDGISVRPGGAWVAYTLRQNANVKRSTANQRFDERGVTDEAMGSSVWITDVHGGAAIKITAGDTAGWSPVWSPNGRYLAYYSDETGKPALWIWDFEKKTSRCVSDAVVHAAVTWQVPKWLPNSAGVVVPIVAQRSVSPTASKAAVAESQAVTGDDRPTVTILTADSAYPYGGHEPAGGLQALQDRPFSSDLALIDISSGNVAVVAHGYEPLDYSVSSDGRYVAFTSDHSMTVSGGNDRRVAQMIDLVVAPLVGSAGDKPETVASNADLYYFNPMVWAPHDPVLLFSSRDAEKRENNVYIATEQDHWKKTPILNGSSAPGSTQVSHWQIRWESTGRGFYAQSANIFLYSSLSAKKTATVSLPENYEIVSLITHRGQGSARDGDEGSVVAAVHDKQTKRDGFVRADFKTGDWKMLQEGEVAFAHYEGFFEGDGNRIFYVASNSQQVPDIWSTEVNGRAPQRITNSAPEMNGLAYGKTQLIHWTTPTGLKRDGTLLLPSEYRPGQKYPLVVYPYPSDYRSNNVFRFGVEGEGVENMQLLATRGMAVLLPDVGLPDVPDAHQNEMRYLADIIMSGVDRAIELGVADPQRLGVIGHSWGGYTVLALLVQTNRFGAAVMRGGLGNLTSDYGQLDPFKAGFAIGAVRNEAELHGTLWDEQERYINNSPVFFLDKVHTPLLIIHGEAETTVPIFFGNEIFSDLQRLGKSVVMARYAGENHGEIGWSFANQRDYLTRIIDWFQGHLEGPVRAASLLP